MFVENQQYEKKKKTCLLIFSIKNIVEYLWQSVDAEYVLGGTS